jgi:hypothetical protein
MDLPASTSDRKISMLNSRQLPENARSDSRASKLL